MEFDLCPSVTLETGTYNAVVAPPETIITALNQNKELQRFMFLYVGGNYSRILTHLHRTVNFEVRRGFTAYQIVTILSEAYHTVILVEHDPTMYATEERNMLMSQVTRALKSTAREAMVILYAPSPDRSFHTLAKQADRVFLLSPPFPDSQNGKTSWGRGRRAGVSSGPRRQITLEAFGEISSEIHP